MNPSTALARVVVDELVRGGVREAVLCPGSRNAPLSFALHDADRAGRLRLHVRIDERTAGFLALGLAKASGRPVPVVTTSGTAAVNLHPAVVEADYSRVPAGRAHRRPAGRDARHRRQPDHRPGQAVRRLGALLRRRSRPTSGTTVGRLAQRRRPGTRPRRGAARCTSTSRFREPLVPDGDPSWPEPLDAEIDRRAPRRRSARLGLRRPRRRRPDRRRRRRPGPAGRARSGRGRRLAAAGRAVVGAPGRAERASPPTGCCSTTSAATSSGWSSPAGRRCPGRSPGCWPATTSRCVRLRDDPRTPKVTGDPRPRLAAPAGWTPTRSPTTPSPGVLDGRAAHRPRPWPGWWPLPCPPTGCWSPGRRARSATSTSPTRGSEPPLVLANRGASGIDGTVSTAVGAALAHGGTGVRPDGRPDVPARQHRAGDRPGRAAARPDRRGRQRRRRRAVHPARAGGAGARGGVRAGLRHAARRRPGGAVRGHRHAARPGRRRSTTCRAQLGAAGPGSGSSRCAPTAPAPATCTPGCGPPSRRRCDDRDPPARPGGRRAGGRGRRPVRRAAAARTRPRGSWPATATTSSSRTTASGRSAW